MDKNVNMGNKTLKTSDTSEQYVIMALRDGVLKGLSKDYDKGYIGCTVIPRKMRKFYSEDAAFKYYETYLKDNKSFNYKGIKKLRTTYHYVFE